MAVLANSMPPIAISQEELSAWGRLWLAEDYQELIKPKTRRQAELGPQLADKHKKPNRFTKKQSVNFPMVIDRAYGTALARMLGGIPVLPPIHRTPLLPAGPDCVEVGAVRIIGGVRPQNFDAAYRPDGPRIVFDSKTLNDTDSIRKNWQNMINDIATEATTVHTRFPYALVTFIVVLPRPALLFQQEVDIIRTLERLGTRKDPMDQVQLAEAISMIVWDPATATIDTNTPPRTSNLRLELMPETIYTHYLARYKGLPPHNLAEIPEEQENGEE